MGSLRKNVLSGLAGLAALAYTAMLFGAWRPLGVLIALDVIPILVPLACAFLCFRAASRCPRESRASWVLFGGGAASWALGDIGFSLLDLFHLEPAGSLSAADIGYLALIPLWGAALLLHPARTRRGLELVGASLDALTIFVAAASVTIAYVLAPIWTSATDAAGAAVSLAYPTGDLILLGAFVSVRARSQSRLRAGEIFIGAAITTFVIGDLGYARLVLMDSYSTGHPIDLTWAGAFVLIALAVRAGLRGRARSDTEMAPVPVLTTVGMAAMIALAGMAVLSAERREVLLAGAVTTGILVVLRQATLLIERSRLARSLDAHVHALEEAQRAKERFLATVSHDLRTPLAAISGFAELLAEPRVLEDHNQVTTFVESIKRNTRRLSRLTEDLLAAGQFASGHPPPLRLETVDLDETVAQAVKDLGYGGRVRVEARAVSVPVDQQRIEQIIGNLLDNAFKHCSIEDGVSVRVGPAPDGAEIEVADKGTGIASERMHSIFDPFVSDFAGTSSAGLGLYVVQNLVKAMGGRVSVTSEVGRGTSFSIYLPAANADDNVVQMHPTRVA